MPVGAPSLTREQVAELRLWAGRMLDQGAAGELEGLARAIVPLADEAALLRDDPVQAQAAVAAEELARIRVRAQTVVQNGAPQELRAAAKAILLLCDDIESRRAARASAVAVRPARRRPGGAVVGLGLAAAAALALAVFALRDGSPGLGATGPASSLVGAEGLGALAFSLPGTATDLADTRWTLDGNDVRSGVRLRGGRIVYRPARLRDGEHTVKVVRGAGSLSRSASWTFTVDSQAPVIRVTKGSLAARRGSPYGITGAVEPGTRLSVNGSRVTVAGDGRFTVPFERVPRRAVILFARDEAGNTTDSRLVVASAPRLPANPVRAVHVSADAWAHDGLRAGVLDLLRRREINAVELDLKDESGIVGWDSGLPLARRIGAEKGIFDLAAAVRLLHARGARVIGRLVAFRDPILARWAWTHGRKDLVIQAPDGSAYSGGYGGFANFASATVQRYNVELAAAAARAGIDDVLYDYVRRPDGPMSSMVVPGLVGDPSAAISGFLARARSKLRAEGTFLGASVFGIAATRPEEIAQDVPAIAREVDYVAPMVYPSHWGPNEYGVASPNAQPYAIVRRSLSDFGRAVRGSGARVVPWLQDFSLGRTYGPTEVRAQIRAARDAGVDEFLLWDPNVTYTEQGLDRTATLPTVGTAASAQDDAALVPLRRSLSPDAPVPGLAPNELGGVPVLMYHQLLADGGGEYDLTPDELRAELGRLLRGDYRPITASSYVRGDFEVPRGTTPVVLTFDDSTTNQAKLLRNGTIDPDSAIGILLDFSRAHPEFRPAGTLYVNRAPFGSDPRASQLARALAAHGFELGNHTYSHAHLDQLSDTEVQSEIVRGNRVIHELLPGARIDTIALPFGLQPRNAALALAGSWGGERYRFRGAFLAGAEPAPAPFSTDFDAEAIPRVRSDPGDLLNGSSDWLRRLEASPDLRYVSDGNPRTITYPVALASKLADAFRARGRAR